MEFQDQSENESSSQQHDLDSLEDTRTTLAGDVVQFLAVASPGSDLDTPSAEHPDPSSMQRQALLRAAVVDLEGMDERLHHARQ